MPLKRQADEKQRAWRRVYRQRYRESLRSAPRIPMHPKNDPKSDRVRCLQSSGLCQTMGSKHHRSNKKCWVFPQICEHCDAVRAGAIEDDEMYASLKPVELLSFNGNSAKAQPSLTDLRSMFNEVSVQKNSKMHTLTTTPVVDDHTARETATRAGYEAIRPLRVGPRHKEPMVESIEKKPSFSLPQTPPATPPTGFLDKQERIDLEQRQNRSQAPSPEACEMRAQWSTTPSRESCGAHERWYSSRSAQLLTTASPSGVNDHREHLKRDPRLDLNFVLGKV